MWPLESLIARALVNCSFGQLGKSRSETDAAFADRSISTRAKETGNSRFSKLQKLVVEFHQAEEKAKADAVSEAELDRYRLHRRHWDENSSPILKEDQDKYNVTQEEAKALLKKVNAESEDFKNPQSLVRKRPLYQELQQLLYFNEEETDTAKFAQENKERLEDAEIDIKEFEGKTVEEVLGEKWEQLIERMKTNKARRRELFEEWQEIKLKVRNEVRLRRFFSFAMR